MPIDKKLDVEPNVLKRFSSVQHLSEHGRTREAEPVLLEEGTTHKEAHMSDAKQLLSVLREGQQEYLITYIDSDGKEKEQKISASSPAEARAKVKKFAKEIVDVETLG
jgi:hypothetical protein